MQRIGVLEFVEQHLPIARIEPDLHVGRVVGVGKQTVRMPLEIGEVERLLLCLQPLIGGDQQATARQARFVEPECAPGAALLDQIKQAFGDAGVGRGIAHGVRGTELAGDLGRQQQVARGEFLGQHDVARRQKVAWRSAIGRLQPALRAVDRLFDPDARGSDGPPEISQVLHRPDEFRSPHVQYRVRVTHRAQRRERAGYCRVLITRGKTPPLGTLVQELRAAASAPSSHRARRPATPTPRAPPPVRRAPASR